MDKTNQRRPLGEPSLASPELEEGVRSPEAQTNEPHSAVDSRATPTPREQQPQPTEMEQELASQAARLAELSGILDTHQNQLRDYEKALVERIADVDDDRRRTAAALQRAWQSHRDQLDERLRRRAWISAVSLFLLAILIPAASWLIYRQVGIHQPLLADENSEIQRQLDPKPKVEARDELVQEKLTQLSASVGAVAAAVDKLNQEQEGILETALADERASRTDSEARLVQEIGRLEAEQQRLAQSLHDLRDASGAAATAVNKVDQGQERIVEQALAGERATRVDSEARLDRDIQRVEAEQQGLAQAVNELREAFELARAESVAGSDRDESLLAAEVEGAPAEQVAPDVVHAATAESAPVSGAGDAENPQVSDSRANADAGMPVEDSVEDSAHGATEPVSEGVIVAGDGSYALQLIGFRSLSSLHGFAAREGLATQAYYLRESFNGRPWHVVIHSLHNDYEAAKAALSDLPEDLAALDPWIRPLRPGTELQALGAQSGR
ncbi:MAG: hypothetical protein U9Q81_16575 [Pseudomonadota bacterium]|nr:hypothetical protein [Pseudomonadota bacterium]